MCSPLSATRAVSRPREWCARSQRASRHLASASAWSRHPEPTAPCVATGPRAPGVGTASPPCTETRSSTWLGLSKAVAAGQRRSGGLSSAHTRITTAQQSGPRIASEAPGALRMSLSSLIEAHDCTLHATARVHISGGRDPSPTASSAARWSPRAAPAGVHSLRPARARGAQARNRRRRATWHGDCTGAPWRQLETPSFAPRPRRDPCPPDTPCSPS